MNELDELRRESCESSRIYKERLKLFHDKNIVRKTFEPHQKVLLYSSRLHIFPGKLRSRWTGPFIVKVVYPYDAVEIENPENGRSALSGCSFSVISILPLLYIVFLFLSCISLRFIHLVSLY